jgi:hypothetical protein
MAWGPGASSSRLLVNSSGGGLWLASLAAQPEEGAGALVGAGAVVRHSMPAAAAQ